MGATVIDGKALAAATKAEAAEKVKALKAQGINPCLAVILVGENPASQVYVRGKINDCAQCGIESRSINPNFVSCFHLELVECFSAFLSCDTFHFRISFSFVFRGTEGCGGI